MTARIARASTPASIAGSVLALGALVGLAAVFVLVPARPVEGRVQGVKGRRMQVFAPLAPYRGGTVFVEEPSVVTGRAKAVVHQQGIKWYVHEFLETRLRELPWAVRPWYDELGPLERHDARGPALVLSSVVHSESGLLGASTPRLAVEVFLRDQSSGAVVARYTGYGWASLRRGWAGSRDDVQEITRVLVDYLADELGSRAPDHLGGYEPEPYRRRSRTEVDYEVLGGVPRMELHGEPPVGHDAPIAERFRHVGDEVHRRHFDPEAAGASPRALGHARSGRPAPPAALDDEAPRSPASRDHARPPFSQGPRRSPLAQGGPRLLEPREAPVVVRDPIVSGDPPARRESATWRPPGPNETVYTQQGSGTFHVDPRCRRLETRSPRRLGARMARDEGLQPCPACLGPAR